MSKPEPPRLRALSLLEPAFRAKLERWLAQARATFPQLNIYPGETRRTLARQRWLLERRPPVTWTLDSRHRWGVAVDLIITRKESPRKAEWDSRLWEYVYSKVRPEDYGLRVLRPLELVHLEDAEAEDLIARAHELGMRQT